MSMEQNFSIQKKNLTDEEFSYNQAILRSKIRIKEGRSKPVDLIFFSVSLLDEQNYDLFEERNQNFMIKEPSYKILDSLEIQEIEEMVQDIQLNSTFDKRKDFWKALLNLCEIKLNELKGVNRNSIVQQDIINEIVKDLETKSYKDLCDFEEDCKVNLQNMSGVDFEFWEEVIFKLQIYKNRALLNEYHIKIMKEFEKIKDTIIMEPNKEFKSKEVIEKEEEMFRRAKENNEIGDYDFRDEAILVTCYPKTLKNPKKPLYYNKICFGMDWKKFNKGSDDPNAPPPLKYVQGYKFHIFYPELINPNISPSFYLEEADELSELTIIKFHSGPPYEDIAFYIVNKEWERSHKRGFKSTFERGMLLLHFEFKKVKINR